MWKEIFLDIVSFFSGKRKDHVIKILEKCGFDATIGIRVLIDNSLLTIEKENLWMHSLLQDMGREIFRQDPRKCSRLWEHEDLSHVLAKHTVRSMAKAPKKIQAVMVNISEVERKGMKFQAFTKVFSKMCNLRLLIIHYEQIPNNSNHDLNFFELFGYSPNCLTSSFQPKELVELDLWSSKIKYIWEGVKDLYQLKCINLCRESGSSSSNDNYRTKKREFGSPPRLEGQYGCIDLVENHPSIGQLSRLFVLERLYISAPAIRVEGVQIEADGFMGYDNEEIEVTLDGSMEEGIELVCLIKQNANRPVVQSSFRWTEEGSRTAVQIIISGLEILRWLKHSTLCLLRSISPLSLFLKLLNGVACIHKHQRTYQADETSTGRKEDESRTAVQIIIPGLEIPRWLTCDQWLENSVSIELPPNWCSSKWMGFALCASFNAISSPSYADEFGNPVKTFGLRARAKIFRRFNGGHLFEIFFNVKVASEHIWLLYLSRDDWFANVDGEYSKIEVVFETYSVNVWKCGAGLLYEQDMEEFHKTFAQCGGSNIITYEGWDGVHYEFENSLDPLL